MSRKNYVDDYAISLDIGNASVGWSAFTPNYRLVRAKGHELIGVRLFDPADTAESRRMARTTRRRYSRRRWRLRLLDALFDQALSEIDPSFLARRKYSWVHPDDENNADCWYGSVLFDSNEQDKRFYIKNVKKLTVSNPFLVYFPINEQYRFLSFSFLDGSY